MNICELYINIIYLYIIICIYYVAIKEGLVQTKTYSYGQKVAA